MVEIDGVAPPESEDNWFTVSPATIYGLNFQKRWETEESNLYCVSYLVTSTFLSRIKYDFIQAYR